MAFEGIEGKLPAYEGKSEIYKLKNIPQYFDKKRYFRGMINCHINGFSYCFLDMGKN